MHTGINVGRSSQFVVRSNLSHSVHQNLRTEVGLLTFNNWPVICQILQLMQQVVPSVLTVNVKLLHLLVNRTDWGWPQSLLHTVMVVIWSFHLQHHQKCTVCQMEVYSWSQILLQNQEPGETQCTYGWRKEGNESQDPHTVGRLAKRRPSTSKVANAVKQHLYAAFLWMCCYMMGTPSGTWGNKSTFSTVHGTLLAYM